MRTARRLLYAALSTGAALAVLVPGTIAHASPSPTAYDKQINALSDQIESKAEEYNGTQIQLQADKTAQARLTTVLQSQQEGLDQASAGITAMARSAYINGPISSMSAVLEAGSPQNFVDELTSLNTLAREQDRQLSTYRQVTTRYQTQKAQLDQAVAKESSHLAQLTAEKNQINAQLKHLYALRQAAYGSATEKGTAYTGTVPYYPGPAGVAVKFAYAQIGCQYTFAEAGPCSTGFDCSGLTMAAWAKAGVTLYHQARVQWTETTHISRSQLQAGDLIFYNSLAHVALYVGGNEMIEAAHAGTPVRKTAVRTSGVYGYGRVKA